MVKRTQSAGLDAAQKEFVKLIEANSRRYRRHEVFRDFCEVAALSISNSVDRSQFEAREARYMEIVARYAREEVARFPAMLNCIVEALSAGMCDCLGQLFMAMELGDHWKGQFFTPYEVSYLMAKLVLGDVAAVIEREGFFTLNEPAAGAGAMVIATANAIQDQGMNYQQVMHVTTTDIDLTAVHMAYIQFTLLHIPAIVIHGNALLPDKTWGHWVTPAHVLGRWDRRLSRRERSESDRKQGETDAAMAEPVREPASAQTPIEVQRDAIVARRIERADQLDLFA